VKKISRSGKNTGKKGREELILTFLTGGGGIGFSDWYVYIPDNDPSSIFF
jgi:hypothetical protein